MADRVCHELATIAFVSRKGQTRLVRGIPLKPIGKEGTIMRLREKRVEVYFTEAGYLNLKE